MSDEQSLMTIAREFRSDCGLGPDDEAALLVELKRIASEARKAAFEEAIAVCKDEYRMSTAEHKESPDSAYWKACAVAVHVVENRLRALLAKAPVR